MRRFWYLLGLCWPLLFVAGFSMAIKHASPARAEAMKDGGWAAFILIMFGFWVQAQRTLFRLEMENRALQRKILEPTVIVDHGVGSAGGYRDDARGLSRECANGKHKLRVVEALKGGAGPDDAKEVIDCERECGAHGWRYMDNSTQWYEPGRSETRWQDAKGHDLR